MVDDGAFVPQCDVMGFPYHLILVKIGNNIFLGGAVSLFCPVAAANLLRWHRHHMAHLGPGYQPTACSGLRSKPLNYVQSMFCLQKGRFCT